MGARSELLRDVVSLDGAASALRQEYDVDRVSIARFSSDHATFEIVGCAGKVLLSPGLEVPTELSTQMRAPALGEVFVEANFRDAPRWNRPVDELMLGIGFQSGCSVPLRCPDGSLGAVSLSATQPDRTLERCVDSIAALLAELAARLVETRSVHLSPREADVLLDLDDGLRFKEIARRRGIREPTAKSYARSLFEKLDAHSRTEAVNRARELGLLSSLRSDAAINAGGKLAFPNRRCPSDALRRADFRADRKA
jgi:DNA-binding CsgD family transcriptional regulator